eukprot:scaffold1575_cov352-Prasinococcus_capsulatus_cf.AAC.5
MAWTCSTPWRRRPSTPRTGRRSICTSCAPPSMPTPSRTPPSSSPLRASSKVLRLAQASVGLQLRRMYRSRQASVFDLVP